MTNDKDSAEYTKLLNEVVTLRWKCGDQAAELAALRQPTQSDAWQPIETAEGKIVIVYDDGFSSLVAYAADNGVYCAEDGMALSHDKLSGAIWMALPDDYPIGFMETNNDHH